MRHHLGPAIAGKQSLTVAAGAHGTGLGAEVGVIPGQLANPRTVLPTLRCILSPGVTTLICAVYAAEDDDMPEAIPKEVLTYAQ